MYTNTIFIHRRDYRIVDNLGLNYCLSNTSGHVYPIFIFTPEQTDKKRNKYYNSNSLEFLVNSIVDLSKAYLSVNGRLSVFTGDNISILKNLVTKLDVDCIVENADYSPYAKNRSRDIQTLCKKLGVEYKTFHDLLLIDDMGTLCKADGDVYKKFTPFYNNAKQFFKTIKTPCTVAKRKSGTVDKANLLNKSPVSGEIKDLRTLGKLYTSNPLARQHGGRTEGLKALNKLKEVNKTYSKTRDLPYINTTALSAHIRFGTLSIREVYQSIIRSGTSKTGGSNTENGNNVLVQQLFWREFYMYLINYLHTNYSKKSDTMPRLNSIKWSTSTTSLEKWKRGETGCPIVDAGMREMNKTGYMHNRLRMICASFLIYHLHPHWKDGERYFAQQLVDYDYINNLGGWLWSSAWEVHSNDYYKAFSMESQTKKFDPQCTYIKKWIPELLDVNPVDLYDWSKSYHKYEGPYIEPIVSDLKEARKNGIALYKK